MTDTATTIAAAPFVAAIQPYIVAIVGAVVTYLVAQVASAVTQWTGARVDATYTAAIEAAAANEAGKLVAGALGNLATAQVTVGSPGVAAAANAIVTASSPVLAKAVSSTGLTPQLAASLIVGQIGRLQAAMTSASPAPKS